MARGYRKRKFRCHWCFIGKRQAPVARKPTEAVFPVEGLWQSALETHGMRLRYSVARFARHRGPVGRVRWTVWIKASAACRPCNVPFKEAAFHFEIPSVAGTFEGTLDPGKNKLSGNWSQTGAERKSSLYVPIIRWKCVARRLLRSLTLSRRGDFLFQCGSGRFAGRNAHASQGRRPVSRGFADCRFGAARPRRSSGKSPAVSCARGPSHAEGNCRSALRQTRHRQIHGFGGQAPPRWTWLPMRKRPWPI